MHVEEYRNSHWGEPLTEGHRRTLGESALEGMQGEPVYADDASNQDQLPYTD